jgi:hypothetical protein
MEFIAHHRRLTWTMIAFLSLLALWLLWPDRRLDQVRAMQKELFGPEAKKLAPDERKSKFAALRLATAAMSPAQTQALVKSGQARFQKEMERYAKLSQKEQMQYLDKQIDNMSKGKKGGGQFGQGQGGGFAKKSGKSMSSEERDRMRRQRLDRSTPELRALMDRYRKDLQARMNARGIRTGAGQRSSRGA